MWKKALELVEEMEERQGTCAPSGVTYSVAITACGNGGQWEKALELLELMRTKNMDINLITYNAAITALSKAAKHSSKDPTAASTITTSGKEFSQQQQLWPKVLFLLDQMRSHGIEPDGFSFSAAISCCGAEGRWEEALHLIELMQQGGPRTRPNKIAYTAAIASCGKAGQVEHALRLFRQMREEGFAADRVAYNALFSALRVAKRADAAFDLWNEMVGRSSSDASKAMATARMDQSATPDIITLTDAVAAISSSSPSFSEDMQRERVDAIFAEAVERGIVLRSDTLDSTWEVDLSGMSLPVARAACRYVVNRIATIRNKNGIEMDDLTFITGVGRGHQRRLVGESHSNRDDRSQLTSSLRDYVQEILLSDFVPPLHSEIPPRAQGTVQVSRDVFAAWIEKRRLRP